uniref:Perilipin n=1 Tax=Cebus imitator TaxID=2715852 RepID=A0A2K5QPU5_CEBIM
MASVAGDPQPSVVAQVVNLPLVSSTYELMSSAHVSTKDQYPYLKPVCEMAEKGVKTITLAAMTGALRIIQKLEPQIPVADTYCRRGLERTEVVANAQGAVTRAKDAVTTTATGPKDSVASMITGVTDKSKGTVTGSSVVSGSINTVLGSRLMQLVSSGLENALTKSELLVEWYLPLTEDELEKEARKVEGFSMVQKPSCSVRLGSLSTKLCALSRVKEAKQKSQETISHRHSAVHLIEFARKNVHSANQKIQDAQDKLCFTWVDWRRSTGCDDTDESTVLSTSSHKLLLLSRPRATPSCPAMGVVAGDIYSVFHSASDSLLTSSKGPLQKMKKSLDDVMDYLVNNTPLNWLVGPFYPQLTESQNAQDQGAEMDKSSQEAQRSEHKTH